MNSKSWLKEFEKRQEEFETAADPACTLYKALCNPVTFPSFANLTDLNDPSTKYYTGWDEGLLVRSREWALLGEVTELVHFVRHRFVLQTRFGEELVLHFYPESLPMPGFNVRDVQVGYTFALLNAEKKTFMDMTDGVRLEQLDTCWAFKASLKDVTDEADKLLAAADAKAEKKPASCFACAKPTTSCCGKCKIARFCSRECQITEWPKHKKLCRDAAKLLSLSCLPRHPYVHQQGHYLNWRNIPGYTKVPPPMKPTASKQTSTQEQKGQVKSE